jgi:hypothetical protein
MLALPSATNQHEAIALRIGRQTRVLSQVITIAILTSLQRHTLVMTTERSVNH